MKLTVKLNFGCGREMKVGTFSEIDEVDGEA